VNFKGVVKQQILNLKAMSLSSVSIFDEITRKYGEKTKCT